MGLNLTKQALLVNNKAIKEYTVHIFGAGSIGSHLCRALAKTGFENIVVYDFDTVEEDNISAQAFGMKHIGMKKLEALKEIIKEETGVEIITKEGKVDEKTEIPIEGKTIYFNAFDSIEARKIVWDKVKDFNVPWGETRIGRFDYRYYFFVPGITPDKWKEEYDGMLQPGQPIADLKCGEKCSFGPNTELVSKVLRQILNIVENKPLTYLFISNWEYPENSIIRTTKDKPKEEKVKTETEEDLELLNQVEETEDVVTEIV